MQVKPRIGIVGAGVAGITAAHYLSNHYEVTLFEKRKRLGGHTNTVIVEDQLAGKIAVDTGFIVSNNRTYPNFHRLMNNLKVPIRDADMSFGYFDEKSEFSYAATGLKGLLPKASHLFNKKYRELWWTLPRFNRVARNDLENSFAKGQTLGEYLEKRNFSRSFTELFLVPMGAAIWSSGDSDIFATPAETFLAFFKNHGLLSILDRPQWQTVIGGSHTYLQAFQNSFTGQILLDEGVERLIREGSSLTLHTTQKHQYSFDRVIFACHADQVIPQLAEATPEEKTLFSAWSYHSNKTILHTDRSYLPPDKSTWASWNYRREYNDDPSGPLSATYHMNRLQGLNAAEEYCVTLNPRREISPNHIIREFDYMHPKYTLASVKTQDQIRALNGKSRTYFCGSYLGWGFHEDAIKSSCEVIEKIFEEDQIQNSFSVAS